MAFTTVAYGLDRGSITYFSIRKENYKQGILGGSGTPKLIYCTRTNRMQALYNFWEASSWLQWTYLPHKGQYLYFERDVFYH